MKTGKVILSYSIYIFKNSKKFLSHEALGATSVFPGSAEGGSCSFIQGMLSASLKHCGLWKVPAIQLPMDFPVS